MKIIEPEGLSRFFGKPLAGTVFEGLFGVHGQKCIAPWPPRIKTSFLKKGVLDLLHNLAKKIIFNKQFFHKKEHAMDEFVRQALEIVRAQAGIRTMTEDEMTSMVAKIAFSLRSISEPGGLAGTMTDTAPEQHMDPKKAVKEKSITCLECGKSFKVLTQKHLATHDLTADAYREKYGYNKGTALIAKVLSKARRRKMQEMQLWKKKGMKMGAE